MELLRLEALGGMQISRGDEPLAGFISAKAPALLWYLAISGRPQFRLVLAGLLWGDLPERAACANLRKALSNLRDLVGPHLAITPQTICFDRKHPYWLDVEEFERQAAASRQCLAGTRRGSAPTSEELRCAAENLRAAVALYRGDFLDGFYVRQAPAFEEWVLAQRERLRMTASQAYQALIAHHASEGDDAAAITYLSRLLLLEPWREEAHRQMMVLLARSGQRSAALAQYEKCRRILYSELGIEPAAETAALHHRIRAGGSPPRHDLPAASTSFVGREEELAEIARLLAAPACRMVTIMGPGGAGKSRLALQAAHQAVARAGTVFPDGIYFIPLATVRTAQALISAIAGPVGLALSPGSDSRAELLGHLRSKEMLLVLDGFEHLVAEADLLSAIQRGCSGVKLLLASRQRLSLQGEWLLELGGLSVPPLGEACDLRRYGAYRLFEERAQQACHGLGPALMDQQAIAYLCGMAGGLPLAIELAAAWAGSMTCLEIAAVLERDLAALSAFRRDAPAHHQSMRACFEHSWLMLSPREQRAFRALGVLHAAFDRETAQKAAGCEPSLLEALADRSLLRREAAGRFAMHDLLRQYALEKLGEVPGERDLALARHGRHYLGEFLPKREADLREGRQGEALEHFRHQFEDVRSAWRWAVDNEAIGEIRQSLLALALLCDMLGWWGEAEWAFGTAVDRLRVGGCAGGPASDAERITRGSLLAMHGAFCVRIGACAKGLALLRSSEAAFKPEDGLRRERAFPLLGLGLLANIQGQHTRARSLLRRSVAILLRAEDPLLAASALDYLGEVSGTLGRHDEAERLLQEALVLHERQGEQWGTARALFGLGQIAMQRGELAEADCRLERSLAMFTALGARVSVARVRAALGENALAAGRVAEACQLLEESLSVLAETGEGAMTARCLAALGRAARASGNHVRGEECLGRALELAESLGAGALRDSIMAARRAT